MGCIKLLFSYTCICLLTVGCELKRVDADYDKVNAEIKERKIKKHAESEIITRAYESGKVVRTNYESILKLDPDTLNRDICTGSMQLPIAETDKALLRSATLYCTSGPTYSAKQTEIWNAYQHVARFDSQLSDNIQYIKEGDFYFYAMPYRYIDSLDNRKVALLGLEVNKREVVLSMQRER